MNIETEAATAVFHRTHLGDRMLVAIILDEQCVVRYGHTLSDKMYYDSKAEAYEFIERIHSMYDNTKAAR